MSDRSLPSLSPSYTASTDLAAVLNALDAALVWIDATAKICGCNTAFARLVGKRQPTALIGCDLLQLLPLQGVPSGSHPARIALLGNFPTAVYQRDIAKADFLSIAGYRVRQAGKVQAVLSLSPVAAPEHPETPARLAGLQRQLAVQQAKQQAERQQRRQTEAILKRQMARDRLLSQVARALLNRDLDAAIEFALRAIGRFTRCDRSYLFRYSADGRRATCTHEWCIPGVIPYIDESQDIPISTFPWVHAQCQQGEVVAVPEVAALPAAAAIEQQEWQRQSIQSLLLVPTVYFQQTVGFLGLDAVRARRDWLQEDIDLLRFIGELVAIAWTRHEADAALERAKEAAEAANQAKSLFLANMSHELRTPLNAILGFAQLLDRDDNLSEDQRQSLGIINRSGAHLLATINDVLSMAKIEAGRAELQVSDFDLHALLDSLTTMLSLRASEKQLDLLGDRAPDLPRFIAADESKLRQVLVNLLSNAIKFTQVGRVILRASVALPAELPASVTAADIYLHFSVEDTGAGIAPEELHKLFAAFEQTETGRQSGEGTGLGLPISRQFVQLMGGDIQVRSTVGEGTCFSFILPCTVSTLPAIAETAPQQRVLALAPGQPAYRLLVADDRWENRQLLLKLFTAVGFEVREAADGREAIAVWEDWQPHLIWMDMRMPVMNGYDAARQIKARPGGEQTAIVALTASAFEEQRSLILAAGCDDCVRKPCDEALLFRKLSEHLGVEFVCEDVAATVEPASDFPADAATQLQAQAAQMPADWLAALQQASLEASAKTIRQLSEQLPAASNALAAALDTWLDNFRFDAIAALVASVQSAADPDP